MNSTTRPTELESIKRDTVAAVSDRGDHQKVNRLALEVMGYMHQHKSPQDAKNLTKALMGGGLRADEAAQLERLGLPSMQLTNEHGSQNVDAVAQVAAPVARANANADVDAAPAKPKSLDEIVHEVHNVEDRYHMTEYASARTQSDLGQAVKDVQKFCKDNPGQAKDLISKLEAQDLIGQLSIAAIEQTSAGQSGRSLSKDEVTNLFSGNDAFSKAVHDHLQKAFSVTPGGKEFGTGYADAVRQGNGHERWGYASGGSDDIPVITKQHLDELMGRFDHGPAYHREGL